MNIYDCFGTFDPTNQNFNLAVQTTNIGFDEFRITKYYNICSPNRYAIIGILQTKNGDATDFSNSKPNSGMVDTEVSFTDLDTTFWDANDLDITKIKKGDKIILYTLHAIGFSLNNKDDRQNILDFKAGGFPIISKGSPPSKGGKGIMV